MRSTLLTNVDVHKYSSVSYTHMVAQQTARTLRLAQLKLSTHWIATPPPPPHCPGHHHSTSCFYQFDNFRYFL